MLYVKYVFFLSHYDQKQNKNLIKILIRLDFFKQLNLDLIEVLCDHFQHLMKSTS